jgi:hypothetical protein
VLSQSLFVRSSQSLESRLMRQAHTMWIAMQPPTGMVNLELHGTHCLTLVRIRLYRAMPYCFAEVSPAQEHYNRKGHVQVGFQSW